VIVNKTETTPDQYDFLLKKTNEFVKYQDIKSIPLIELQAWALFEIGKIYISRKDFY
jgi:hypothetical protein